MDQMTVQALENLAQKLDNKSSCSVKRMSRCDQIILQLPWLIDKLSYEEIHDVVHWCVLLWSNEEANRQNNLLNVANITSFRDSEEINTRAKVTEVKLEILRQKRIKKLVRECKVVRLRLKKLKNST